jgi:hypothetical protein
MRWNWCGFPHSGDAHSPSFRQEYFCAQLTNAHTTPRAYEAELVPHFSFLRAGARLCAPAHRRAKRPSDTDRGVRCRPGIVSMGSGKGKALVAYSVRHSLQAGGASRHMAPCPSGQVEDCPPVQVEALRLFDAGEVVPCYAWSARSPLHPGLRSGSHCRPRHREMRHGQPMRSVLRWN